MDLTWIERLGNQLMHRRAKPTFISAICLLSLVVASAQTALAEDAKKEDNVLYVLGVAVSQGLGAFGLNEAELAVVLDGIKDGVTGEASHVNPRDYMAQIQALQLEREAAVAAAEKELSIKFIDAAAKKEGAKQLDSGLVITTISEGGGASPAPTDTVRVHYHGTLRNGTVFDSSVERNEPATFPLNRVIPCWTEGVGMMKVGGKSQLVCPSDIAYGDRGRPPTIPGGAALVFDVELIEVVSAAAPQ
jgi:FKBP-type peptidyl-prolyl cis-trans isomerase FkpA